VKTRFPKFAVKWEKNLYRYTERRRSSLAALTARMTAAATAAAVKQVRGMFGTGYYPAAVH
jgi:hypothetical protein